MLVATDIAARGIDIDELSHVINFNLPNIPETYVHRIGRTGRAGLSGTSISFCDEEEIPYLKDIEKLIGKTIPKVEDHTFKMTLSTKPIKEVEIVSKTADAKPTKSKANSKRKPKSEWFTNKKKHKQKKA